MKHLALLALVAFFANCQNCFGDIIFTITPTNRVDAQTTVAITYTVTGAADLGTQDFAAFNVRVTFPNALFPAGSLPFSPTEVTRAPDNTPFGAGGPFANVSVSPGTRAVTWQANNAADPVPGPNNTVDTTGALVGTFDIVWNRLANTTYDAAIPVDRLTGGYKLAGSLGADPFIAGQTSVGVGVSTIIGVPEPCALTMCGVVALLGTARSLRRRLR